MAIKKVYYYKGFLTQISSGADVHFSKIKEHTLEIITKNAVDNTVCKTLDVTPWEEDMKVIFDIYDYENSRLFGALSKQKASNTLKKHDYTTFKSLNILSGDENDENTGIEVYTYCLLDYETGVLSFVSRQGAPSEKSIQELLFTADLDTPHD